MAHVGGRPQDHEASSCCPPSSRRSSFQSAKEVASEVAFAFGAAAASDAEAAGDAEHCEDRDPGEAQEVVQKHQRVGYQVRHLRE